MKTTKILSLSLAALILLPSLAPADAFRYAWHPYHSYNDPYYRNTVVYEDSYADEYPAQVVYVERTPRVVYVERAPKVIYVERPSAAAQAVLTPTARVEPRAEAREVVYVEQPREVVYVEHEPAGHHAVGAALAGLAAGVIISQAIFHSR